jgi:hypothetical protein
MENKSYFKRVKVEIREWRVDYLIYFLISTLHSPALHCKAEIGN